MKCEIILATRNRLRKLTKMLKSIENAISFSDEIKVHIGFDSDVNNYLKIRERKYAGVILDCVLFPDHVGSVAIKNKLMKRTKESVIYATDDIVFKRNAIRNAVAMLNREHWDTDAVIGFIQTGNEFHETGVALVGKKFIERYTDKQIFNPEYYHFACQEIYWLSQYVGKFKQCKDAEIHHYHPDTHKNSEDRTHHEARLKKDEDLSLMRKRLKSREIWGRS